MYLNNILLYIMILIHRYLRSLIILLCLIIHLEAMYFNVELILG